MAPVLIFLLAFCVATAAEGDTPAESSPEETTQENEEALTEAPATSAPEDTGTNDTVNSTPAPMEPSSTSAEIDDVSVISEPEGNTTQCGANCPGSFAAPCAISEVVLTIIVFILTTLILH